jgi:hypothetical protein
MEKVKLKQDLLKKGITILKNIFEDLKYLKGI